jgi:hypothetical protein
VRCCSARSFISRGPALAQPRCFLKPETPERSVVLLLRRQVLHTKSQQKNCFHVIPSKSKTKFKICSILRIPFCRLGPNWSYSITHLETTLNEHLCSSELAPEVMTSVMTVILMDTSVVQSAWHPDLLCHMQEHGDRYRVASTKPLAAWLLGAGTGTCDRLVSCPIKTILSVSKAAPVVADAFASSLVGVSGC